MYLAHLTPGYFAASLSEPYWSPEWNQTQRGILWAGALISTFAPDFDVIYNILFRGFANHSTLWTHTIWLHGGIALAWMILALSGKWRYGQFLIGLIAFGGLSHLVLDMIVHNTPIFYPFSYEMIGIAPSKVAQGGIMDYVTHPIFLLEPLLLLPAIISTFRRITATLRGS